MEELEILKKEYKANSEKGKEIAERYSKRMDKNKVVFDAIFHKIWEIEPRTENAQNPFASTKDITMKAIKEAGFEDNKEIVTAFSQHEKDYSDFSKLDAKGLELGFKIASFSVSDYDKPDTNKVDEWQFYPIRIIAPQQIQEKIIKPMIEAQAIKGEGLFTNSTNIPLEDEEEDKFLMIEAYNCNGSMSGYWQELKDFGIIGIGKTDGFLSYQSKQCLLQLLNEVATYIKNHTDAPSEAKNKVINTLKALDKLPVWGLFFQILLLQGLCRWLENMDIDEKDPSIKEAPLFYNWLCMALAEKELNFCFVPYGDEDKKQLKPLCNYLYKTELGKAVQEHIFGKHEQIQQKEASTNILPSELNTDEALKYFARAKENGLIDDNYKWLKGKQLLACFCHDMSKKLTLGKCDRIAWKPFEKLFGITKGTLRSNYNDIQKTGQNPSDIALVDSIFQ